MAIAADLLHLPTEHDDCQWIQELRPPSNQQPVVSNTLRACRPKLMMDRTTTYPKHASIAAKRPAGGEPAAEKRRFRPPSDAETACSVGRLCGCCACAKALQAVIFLPARHRRKSGAESRRSPKWPKSWMQSGRASRTRRRWRGGMSNPRGRSPATRFALDWYAAGGASFHDRHLTGAYGDIATCQFAFSCGGKIVYQVS